MPVLRSALRLAQSWEETGADAVLGNSAIYKATPEQKKRANQMKRAAKKYSRMRKYLESLSER